MPPEELPVTTPVPAVPYAKVAWELVAVLQSVPTLNPKGKSAVLLAAIPLKFSTFADPNAANSR
jgi:hypothetical protein